MEHSIEPVVYVVSASSSSLLDWMTVLSSIAASISAVVAAFALNYARKQLKESQTQNRILVQPYLSSWVHTDGAENTYIFSIENTGLGPAIIKEITLTVDGDEIEGSVSDLIAKAAKRIIPEKHDWSIEMFGIGDYVPAGKRFNIYTAKNTQMQAENIQKEFERRAHLTVVYASITGEVYYMDSNYA